MIFSSVALVGSHLTVSSTVELGDSVVDGLVSRVQDLDLGIVICICIN